MDRYTGSLPFEGSNGIRGKRFLQDLQSVLKAPSVAESKSPGQSSKWNSLPYRLVAGGIITLHFCLQACGTIRPFIATLISVDIQKNQSP